MAKAKTQFICQNCGSVYPRWAGKCENCHQWNSLIEEQTHHGNIDVSAKKGKVISLISINQIEEEPQRLRSGIRELDHITGGGFVPSSALLLGGDPGIGKSTLLTQAAAALSRSGYSVVYISGEEAISQIRLRAQRLGISESSFSLAVETNVEDILATLKKMPTPHFVIIDSIQTLWSSALDSAPGTVTQVRHSSQMLIHFAKQTGAALILVGHVTKDGQIAGPRVVEHMVDGVLYFEGERGHQYRILRAVKNRFGATDELGIFEMTSKGLAEVANPSQLFLGNSEKNTPGIAVFAGIEGSRPILVEVQALVAPSALGMARRAVLGWDGNRLSMVLAALEAHCRLSFAKYDVYLNVAAGFRINEPAGDLAIIAAILSALTKKTLPPATVYFGEMSLSGSLRGVAFSGKRLKEAAKLGFEQAYLPKNSKDIDSVTSMEKKCFGQIKEFVAEFMQKG